VVFSFFSFLVFYFLCVFNGQFCDVTKVTIIPKKKKEKQKKKGPNSPTSLTTKILFFKKEGKGGPSVVLAT
jgi:hypothetical protein